MSLNEIDEIGRNFLMQVYTETQGDPAVSVSMYDIGTALGLERNDASRVAEDLMSWELVEIRTLSGGIGINPEAVSEIQVLAGDDAQESGNNVRLGNDFILSDTGKQLLENLVGEIKSRAGALGLGFEALSEMMTDLKTMDAQLESPRPKTAIFRECLDSILVNIAQTDASPLINRIRTALRS